MLDKRFEILGFLSIILLSGITVHSAFADIRFSGDIDLNCPTTTIAEFQKTVAFLEMCPIDFPVEGGGTAPSTTTSGAGEAGGQQSVSSLSDVPSLSFVPSEPTEPRTIDEVFDLFAQLNQFFTPTVQEVPTLPPIVEEEVPEPIEDFDLTKLPPPLFTPQAPEPVRESFIDTIRSFFSSLFG